jgi:hypothetical protein
MEQLTNVPINDLPEQLEDTAYSKNKFRVVLCAIHNERIHGFTQENDPNIHGHYLVIESFPYINKTNYFKETSDEDDGSYFDYDDDSDIEDYERNPENLYFSCKLYNNVYKDPMNNRKHRLIRNYFNIVNKDNYIKPEIAECIYLKGDEMVAILKTFWIRLIQRKWKKIHAQKKQILMKRMNPSNIIFWQQTGRWPLYCNVMPGIRGMMAK